MSKRVKFTEHDVDIMARTLFGEAESQNRLDAQAIAGTIINRIIYPNWPDDAASVCLQPWQYSCWNANDPNRTRIQNAKGKWFDVCKEIAFLSLKGLNAKTEDGCTHYYATYVKKPRWANGKKPADEVKHANGHSHLFFNNIDTAPPKSSREALDQLRPVSGSRSVKGGAVVATTGALAATVGVIGQVAPAVPVVREVAETAEHNPFGLFIAFGAIVIAAAAYIIYARLDDRMKGKR